MKKKFRNDLILIAAVLSIAAIALCAYLILRSPGQKVVVSINGKVCATYRLNEIVDEEFVSPYGTNRLIIKDGKASVSEASCPDLVCVHHYPISYEGESIACKPHTFIVSIE